MELVRRWWIRYGLQMAVVSLGIAIAWILRQSQGLALMETYEFLSRPFQAQYSAQQELQDAKLRDLQYRLTESENQNQRFKTLLGDEPRITESSSTWATVIGRSADSWWQQIMVGRGSNDGIKIGSIAVGPGGLVGRVTNVSTYSSRILLISDPTSQVGAIISRTRQMGVLRGQTQDSAVLEFFERDPAVKPGDIVMTSPFSTLFPPGIPIGRVRSVNIDKQPAPEAIVEFSAPMGLLEFVKIYPFTAKE